MAERKFNIKLPNSKGSAGNEKIPDNIKTLLMISKESGIDKQRIYRYVKNNNVPYQLINDVMYIDETVQTQVVTEINKKSDMNKNHSKSTSKSASKAYMKQLEAVIKILEKELDNKSEQLQEKDKQIANLIRIIETDKRQ